MESGWAARAVDRCVAVARAVLRVGRLLYFAAVLRSASPRLCKDQDCCLPASVTAAGLLAVSPTVDPRPCASAGLAVRMAVQPDRLVPCAGTAHHLLLFRAVRPWRLQQPNFWHRRRRVPVGVDI